MSNGLKQDVEIGTAEYTTYKLGQSISLLGQTKKRKVW